MAVKINFKTLFIVAGVFTQISCSSPAYDVSNPIANTLAKNAAIDAAIMALSAGNCAGALEQVLPLYNSLNTDNTIRMMVSATYGCYAGVNVLAVLNNLITSGAAEGSGFFEFVVSQFPSTTDPFDDKIPQSAMNAMDAAMSALKPGTVLIPSYTINSTSYNPGSIISADRISDSNTYMSFLSLALMGSLQSRGGLPTSNNHKSQDLPWTTAADAVGDGCAYASALLHYYDSVKFLKTVATGSGASVYETLETFLGTALDTGCNLGCDVICGGAADCDTCPATLRNRDSCTGDNTDPNSCAAAGLAFFVNTAWTGPP